MKRHRWIWKSKAHPSGLRGFIFSVLVSRTKAKHLIRQYWDVKRLPTGFVFIKNDEVLSYTMRPGEDESIEGITIMPIKIEVKP
jgi:hypothetical protein